MSVGQLTVEPLSRDPDCSLSFDIGRRVVEGSHLIHVLAFVEVLYPRKSVNGLEGRKEDRNEPAAMPQTHCRQMSLGILSSGSRRTPKSRSAMTPSCVVVSPTSRFVQKRGTDLADSLALLSLERVDHAVRAGDVNVADDV